MISNNSTTHVVPSIGDQIISTTDQIISTTDQITSTTDQITSTTDQITTTTDQITSTTDQITSTTDQITSTSGRFSVKFDYNSYLLYRNFPTPLSTLCTITIPPPSTDSFTYTTYLSTITTTDVYKCFACPAVLTFHNGAFSRTVSVSFPPFLSPLPIRKSVEF